ncbi:MAG: hypothetical protein ACREJC_13015 [Tepidisphaeraceae bacterium]
MRLVLRAIQLMLRRVARRGRLRFDPPVCLYCGASYLGAEPLCEVHEAMRARLDAKFGMLLAPDQEAFELDAERAAIQHDDGSRDVSEWDLR